MLNILILILHVHGILQEDLIENVVLPFLSHVETDEDVAVREAAVTLLVELCLTCQSKRCTDLLDIINKVSP